MNKKGGPWGRLFLVSENRVDRFETVEDLSRAPSMRGSAPPLFQAVE